MCECVCEEGFCAGLAHAPRRSRLLGSAHAGRPRHATRCRFSSVRRGASGGGWWWWGRAHGEAYPAGQYGEVEARLLAVLADGQHRAGAERGDALAEGPGPGALDVAGGAAGAEDDHVAGVGVCRVGDALRHAALDRD